jgi:hypothetical protein
MLLAAGKFSLVDKNTLSGTAVRLSTCAGGIINYYFWHAERSAEEIGGWLAGLCTSGATKALRYMIKNNKYEWS